MGKAKNPEKQPSGKARVQQLRTTKNRELARNLKQTINAYARYPDGGRPKIAGKE